MSAAAAVLPFSDRVSALEAVLTTQQWFDSGQIAALDPESVTVLFCLWHCTHSHGRETNAVGVRRLARLTGLAVGTVRDRVARLQAAGMSFCQPRERVHETTGKTYRERHLHTVPVKPEIRERAKQIRRAAAHGTAWPAPPQEAPRMRPTPPKEVRAISTPAPPQTPQEAPQMPPQQRPRHQRRPRWEPLPEQADAVRCALNQSVFTEKAGEPSDEVVRQAAGEGHKLGLSDDIVGYRVSAAVDSIAKRWQRRPPLDFRDWPYLYSSIRNQLQARKPSEPRDEPPERGAPELPRPPAVDGVSADREMAEVIARLAEQKTLKPRPRR